MHAEQRVIINEGFIKMRFTFSIFCIVLLVSPVEARKPYSGTIGDFVGINTNAGAYDSGIIERLAKTASWVREYHRWEWYEQSPNVYGWDDDTPAFDGQAWPFHTRFVEACLKNNLNILLCNERTAVWSSTNGQWNNPPHGDKDGTIEDHYIDKAEFIAQQVARYGSQKIDASKLQTRDKLSGLNAIRYYEDDNEPDQWWWQPTWPASKYAKYLNAVHDGYNVASDENYPLVGIKNVDPHAVHVLGGMNGDDVGYMDEILANTAGRIPFDILNFHHYCSPSMQAPQGVCPEHEEFGFKKTVDMWLDWRDKNLPDMPIWCTEFGWDTYKSEAGESSYIFAPEASQANYLLRSFFVFMHYGIEKAFVFYDVDPSTGDLTPFMSSGIMSDSKTGLVPKPSFYYLATLQKLVADYNFVKTEKYGEGDPAVYSYKLAAPKDEKKFCYVLYCRNPHSMYDDGTTIQNYKFNQNGIIEAACFEPVDNDEYGQQIQVDVHNAGTESASAAIPLLTEKPLFLFVTVQ